jgi:tRNA(Ile)-lysidine synthase
VFERPLLRVPGAELRAWLNQIAVDWIEDPSNQNVAFTRTRIRHALLPALQLAFPAFRETFARSARHAAQAQLLLAEVAAQDLAAMGGTPVLRGLQGHSRERQANLLRHWLRSVHDTAPSAAQLDELLDQVDACRTRGHRIRIRVGEGFVERAGEALAWSSGGSATV